MQVGQKVHLHGGVEGFAGVGAAEDWCGFGTCGCGRRVDFVGKREGDVAVALEQGAQEASGFAVGDVVFEEAVEDGPNFEGDLRGFDPGKSTAELGPAGEAGVAVPSAEGWRPGGFGPVVAAEGLVTGGDAAAFVAVGETKFTFGGLHGFLQRREKAARRRPFSFFAL